MAQSAHILHNLNTHVFQEFRIVQRINAARKDEILPDQDAVPVAQIVESLFLIEATAPNAQHVLVRLGSRANERLQGVIGDARRE